MVSPAYLISALLNSIYCIECGALLSSMFGLIKCAECATQYMIKRVTLPSGVMLSSNVVLGETLYKMIEPVKFQRSYFPKPSDKVIVIDHSTVSEVQNNDHDPILSRCILCALPLENIFSVEVRRTGFIQIEDRKIAPSGVAFTEVKTVPYFRSGRAHIACVDASDPKDVEQITRQAIQPSKHQHTRYDPKPDRIVWRDVPDLVEID